FQAEDGIRDGHVTGVQTCALPIWKGMDPVDIANRLKESDKNMVAVIVELSPDRVQIVAAAGEGAVSAGINASEIVSGAAKAVGRSEERRVGEGRRSGWRQGGGWRG